MLLEAGHAAQNLVLLATDLGLGALCIGGFHDALFNRRVGLDGRTQVSMYCVGVGHPAHEEGGTLARVDSQE